jgi:hypothetical protein
MMRPIWSVVLAVTAMALTIGEPVQAGKPTAASDFTISVTLEAVDWAWNPNTLAGTFSSRGAIDDAGDVYYLGWFEDPDGRPLAHLEFVGAFGSFETVLPQFPEHQASYPFELTGVTGDYADLFATGTATARTKTFYFWWHDPSGRQRLSYLNVYWTMRGSVH